MSPLTAIDVLRIWELGERKHAFDQALIILAKACPELTSQQLADLSLGQRDRRLLILHQWHFGSELQGFVECPACRDHLEFSMGIPLIEDVGLEPASAKVQEFSADGFDLRFRPPNSHDLIAATACPDIRQARQLLIQCCLQDASQHGLAIPITELPEAILTQLANRIAACDPWQEVLLDLTCTVCEHRWQPPLDIVSFLWEELSAQARRLLREVHALARAYGWRETDILALNARRRRSYLEMVGA